MATAAVLASGSARVAGKAVVTLAHANLVALSVAETVAVAGAQLGLARLAGVSLHALTHVVDALANGERAVLLAEGELAAQATVASLAQANAAGALAIAAASRRAKLGAARATVSGFAGAFTLLALAVAVAHLRASLH